MSRTARLVVPHPRTGEVLVVGGQLPTVEPELPWWAETETLLIAARPVVRFEVTVLRRLEVVSGVDGGDSVVSYLLEAHDEDPPGEWAPLEVPGMATHHELRADWARPGWLAATLRWVDAELERHGRVRTGRPTQVKAWNLSSVLRIPTDGGDVWCKAVPPFFAQEGICLRLLQDRAVPRLLAHDPVGRRSLLEDVPGEDQWEGSEEVLTAAVRELAAIQLAAVQRVDELLAAGIPDDRVTRLPGQADTLVSRVAGQLGDDAARVATSAAALPALVEELSGCGIPETLVHGDFHPGNLRAWDGGFVILDWTDAAVGHPFTDLLPFLDRVRDAAVAARLRRAYLDEWRMRYPAADVDRATALAEVAGAFARALTYQRFLDGIEPAEWVDHQQDVPDWLRRAAEAGR